MKRSDFFKRLGLGAAAVVIAPKVIADIVEEEKAPLLRGKQAKVFLDDDLHFLKNRMSGKAEWYEESRLHFKIKAKVANSINGTIRVMLPSDHKFRLQDVVMVGHASSASDAYLVTDVSSIKFYDALNDVHGETIGLTAYSTDNPIEAGEEVLLMLIGNDYAPEQKNDFMQIKDTYKITGSRSDGS